MQAGVALFFFTPTPARTPIGVGFTQDISMGQALSPSWVLSGALVQVVGETVDREPNYFTGINAFIATVTYYFPSNAFVGLGFGFGAIQSDDTRNQERTVVGVAPGWIARTELGYEAWVSQQWALGGALRLTAARAEEQDAGPHAPVWNSGTVAILFSSTYN